MMCVFTARTPGADMKGINVKSLKRHISFILYILAVILPNTFYTMF